MTFGDADNDGRPLETVLTSKGELGSKQSLDYLFQLNREKSANWKFANMKVEKFLAAGQKFT